MSEPWMSGVKQRAVDAWMNDNPDDVLTEVIRDARAALAAAEWERDEARLDVRTLQAAPDMNGDAIMEARAYLKEHLGVSAAFFDDCIHNAVALCLQARESRDAAVALAEALRETLMEFRHCSHACSDRSCPHNRKFDKIDVAALAMTDAGALEALRERVRAEALEPLLTLCDERLRYYDGIGKHLTAEGQSGLYATTLFVNAIRALAGGRKGDGNG